MINIDRQNQIIDRIAAAKNIDRKEAIGMALDLVAEIGKKRAWKALDKSCKRQGC